MQRGSQGGTLGGYREKDHKLPGPKETSFGTMYGGHQTGGPHTRVLACGDQSNSYEKKEKKGKGVILV